MKSKTHIVVLRMRELIYTALFLVFAVILVLLLIFMFGKKKESPSSSAPASVSSLYVAGVYTSSLVLNDNIVDIQVTVDQDHINAVSIVNLEESVATMYPLLETCIGDISSQLANNVPLENITYDTSNQYTSSMLIAAIERALAKAAPQ